MTKIYFSIDGRLKLFMCISLLFRTQLPGNGATTSRDDIQRKSSGKHSRPQRKRSKSKVVSRFNWICQAYFIPKHLHEC